MAGPVVRSTPPVQRPLTLRLPAVDSSVSDLVLVDPLTEELLLPGCAWARFLQSEVLPPLQTLHVSAAAGVSRVLLMLGLLQPPPMETAAVEAEVVTNRQVCPVTVERDCTLFSEIGRFECIVWIAWWIE